MNSTVFLLLDLLLKSTALLALATAVTQLWPRASAAARHLVWVAAFATLLLLPLARLAAPRWTFALPGSAHALVQAATPARQPLTIRANAGSGSAAQPAGRSVATVQPHPARHGQLPDWKHVILGVWAGGVLLVLTRRLIGAMRVRSLRDESTQLVDERVQELAADAAETLGVRAFDLRQSARCRVPLTWGTWRPVVMLPIAARDWPASRLLAALRHELAHVRRRDHLTRLLAQIACALYWPNAFVWLAARALRAAQEQACDDLVLRAGTCPDDYAAQLFEVSRMLALPGAFVGHAVAMAHPSTLEERLRAIVDGSRNRAPASGAATLAMVLCTTALVIVSGVAQVGAASLLHGQLPELEIAGRQLIELRAEFIELSATEFDALFPQAKDKPGHLATLSSRQISELRKKLEPLRPASYVVAPGFSGLGEDHVPDFAGNKLPSVTQVTTSDGQHAGIEIIREHQVVGRGGGFETVNEGITLEVEPRLRSDGLHLPFRAILVELLPNAPAPLTSESFHRVDFQAPEPDGLHLRADEVAAFGGWETAHAGRKLLMLIEGRSDALALAGRLAETVLPEVRLTGVTVREAADYLMQRMPAWEPPVEAFLARTSRLSIVAHPGPDARNVTLNLRNVSAADALRELARAAGLHVYLDVGSVHLAAPLPQGALEQANTIVLPEVKLTGVTLPEALDKLTSLARQQHPEATRLRIERQIPADFRSPPLTIAMTNIPLSTALALVAELAQCELSANDDLLYIHRPDAPPPGTRRLLAPPIGAGAGVARVATEAEVRTAENIAIDVKFIELPLDQLAAAWWKPPGDAAAGTIMGILTAEQTQELVRRLNSTGGVDLLTAPRVKSSSGKEATVEIGSEFTLDDPQQTRAIGTIAVTVKPTLGPDGQTLDLEIAPWRSHRRVADNATLFSTRKIWTTVSIFTGQTVILVGRRDVDRHAQLVLVTASILPP